VICLDEMGPQASKSYPGRRLVRPAGPLAERARQEIDYGRRGVAGYVFGALRLATGQALTRTCERRTTANWVDYLSAVEAWIDPAVERVYAVLDNLNVHSAPDVLLFSLLHPRWEFVFQPTYAAVPEPDRAVVEGAALPGAEWAPVRGLGRDRARRRAGHGLRERAQAPLRLGPTPAPPSAPPPGRRHRPKNQDNLADAPLSGDR
jgi:DDE superfamily endonuclease